MLHREDASSHSQDYGLTTQLQLSLRRLGGPLNLGRFSLGVRPAANGSPFALATSSKSLFRWCFNHHKQSKPLHAVAWNVVPASLALAVNGLRPTR